MKNLILILLVFLSIKTIAQTNTAYVAPGDLRIFLDYNLGADNSLPSTQPSLGIKGDKYQFGKITPVNSSSWGSVIADDNAWGDPKTSNDPCPSGYRVPTAAEWQGLLSNNSIQWVGDFIEDGTNMYTRHTSGVLINNSLFLPAAGSNHFVNGNLFANNANGTYWSSNARGAYNEAKALSFTKSLISNSQMIQVAFSLNKNTGANVRCIQELDPPRLFLNTIDNKKNKQIKIYPNPTENFIIIEGVKDKVEIYDLSGKYIKSIVSKGGINISDLSKGEYILKTKDNTFKIIRK